jgi:hypothetical protein
LTGSPPRRATSMPTGSPAAPRRRNCYGQSTRRLRPAATIYARADPARSSSAATGRRTHCNELLQPEDPLCYPCPSSGASTRSQRPPFFRPFQFFDHTGSRTSMRSIGRAQDACPALLLDPRRRDRQLRRPPSFLKAKRAALVNLQHRGLAYPSIGRSAERCPCNHHS